MVKELLEFGRKHAGHGQAEKLERMKEMLLQRNTRCEHSIGSVKQYVLSNVQAEGSHLCFRKVVKLQPQSQGLILLYFPMGFQIAQWLPRRL